jgi:hypothetical protein
VDSHAIEDEEPSRFADDNRDAENTRQRILQLDGLAHLDQSIATLLLTGDVRALVGDQVGNRIGFLAELQPSPLNFKVGVTLDQRSLVLCSKLFTYFNGSRRIAISRLQLQISAQARDALTLFAPIARLRISAHHRQI